MRDQTSSRFLGSVEGALSVVAGVLAPLLVGLGLGAVDVTAVIRERAVLQEAADSAALAAATELRLATPASRRIASLASAYASAKLKGDGASPVPAPSAPPSANSDRQAAQSETEILATPQGPVEITTTLDLQKNSVETRLSRHVPTYMLKYFGASIDAVRVAATARLMGASPLCILALEPKEDKAIALLKTSLVTAKGCAAQANSASHNGLTVDDATSRLTATKVCAGTTPTKGPALVSFAPSPIACPPSADPLASRTPIPTTPPCISDLRVRKGEAITILTGPVVQCYKRIEVMDGGSVTIRGGGVIAFGAPPKGFGKLDGLIVRKGGRLETAPGDGATFYFMNGGTFAFLSGSLVSLSAPTGGRYPGFLFIEDPNGKAKKDYHISSVGVSKLLGTIYLSKGYLRIDLDDAAAKTAVDDGDPDENDSLLPLPPGTVPTTPTANTIAGASAYTIVVARKIEVKNKANLVMNSDYSATSVPVPEGVGPTGGTVVVSQ
ncbi:pilus assembly protein TadG-related protein [Alsobacter sp. KACC 23698]|uniref:Pilus assembly protein TadG-related protein n=1 Tax=Alsobacter sp. KACC 23698 TaxID=3149229 RepID=A0AAU7JK48_9HYPH